ncbi:MAG: histidine phosphatase family protein [Firmicutes bacterium]|nr:histidine phosphatase family protein [Bacillota bacterium]
MALLYLVRHGETTWNREGRFQGQADAPLSDLGREQASRVAERLRATGLGVVVASDLSRARDTAQAVAEAAGVPLVLEPAFRELSFGLWQGSTRAEIEARFGDALRAYLSDPDHGRAEGGESFAEAMVRVRSAADRLLRERREERMAWVMHGGSIRALLCAYLDWPARRRGVYRLDNAGVSLLEVRPAEGFVSLHYLNDTHHLGGPRERPGRSPGGDAF